MKPRTYKSRGSRAENNLFDDDRFIAFDGQLFANIKDCRSTPTEFCVYAMLLQQAALFLQLRPSTIRAWILRRRLPYVKLGGLICFRRADLEALIDRSLVQAPNVQDGFKSAGSSPPGRPDDRSRGGQSASGGGR